MEKSLMQTIAINTNLNRQANLTSSYLANALLSPSRLVSVGGGKDKEGSQAELLSLAAISYLQGSWEERFWD